MAPYYTYPDQSTTDWVQCHLDFHDSDTRITIVPSDMVSFAPEDVTVAEFRARFDSGHIQLARPGTRIARMRTEEKMGGYTLVTTAKYIEGGCIE